MVAFFKQMLRQNFIREDYEELLHLGLICLGDQDHEKFRRPGAIHHARWMAKAIYALKIYLFRHQFNAGEDFNIKLERFVLFVIRIYMYGWYNAPRATAAPSLDLKFIEQLRNYDDTRISEATYNKFMNHLWYLSEVNICLALFDVDVNNETKRKMASKFSKTSKASNLKRVQKYKKNSKLEEFITKNSWKFFDILGMGSPEWIRLNPDKWNEHSQYRLMQERCMNLAVVNDAAERALGLAGDLNSFGPTSDTGKLDVLLNVSRNMKEQNNSLKSSVVEYIQHTLTEISGGT